MIAKKMHGKWENGPAFLIPFQVAFLFLFRDGMSFLHFPLPAVKSPPPRSRKQKNVGFIGILSGCLFFGEGSKKWTQSYRGLIKKYNQKRTTLPESNKKNTFRPLKMLAKGNDPASLCGNLGLFGGGELLVLGSVSSEELREWWSESGVAISNFCGAFGVGRFFKPIPHSQNPRQFLPFAKNVVFFPKKGKMNLTIAVLLTIVVFQ